MATETQVIRATCLCGAANHDISLKPSDIPVKGYMCHCDSCRHTFGTMCSTLVFPPAYYEPSQSVLDKVTKYDFSPRVSMYFCTTCGCHMLADGAEEPNQPRSFWFLGSGTLSRIEGIVDWQMHEFVEDTLDGGFADFLPSINGKHLPRCPGAAGKGEEVPIPWTAPGRPTTNPSPNDKLLAQCKCTGVSFYISRPSTTSTLAEQYYPDFPPPNSISTTRNELSYLRSNNTKFLAGLCACDSCRLACGMETVTWAFVPTCDISLDEAGKEPWTPDFGTLRQYESSPGRYRYFCGTCGAMVFYDCEGRQWLKDVAFGLLRAPEGSRAESWFGWRTSRLGYRDDAIPRAESYSLAIEKGLREWEERREDEDLSGSSQSGGAL
ncbi:hypothetical protein AC579_4594 [Lecanosticta acicola]|uniref:CENP-V/GFA domain-containing protein n=1 Tax=Lecanosticta acicola TaxID=111012 RepID=A0AAI8Z154_9PEZI|nr:hypothetical protein AC579_4594 [Lecanosticta acicola]